MSTASNAEHGGAPGGHEAGGGSLGSWIAKALAGDQHEVLLESPATTVRRGQLRSIVQSWAETFAPAGAGAVVAVQLPPSFTAVGAVLGALVSECRVFVIDAQLTEAETRAVLRRAGCRLHVRADHGLPLWCSFQDQVDTRVAALTDGRGSDETMWRLLQMSSGTSGLPKAVWRDDASLLREIDRWRGLPDCMTCDDRVLLLGSPAHAFGLIGGVLQALLVGFRLQFLPALRSTAAVQLRAMGTTVVMGVPAQFDLLSRAPIDRALRLRVALSGGERLPDAVERAFSERYDVRVGQAYGTTETGLIAADLTGRSPGTVGRPADGVQTRIDGEQLLVALRDDPYVERDSGRWSDGWFRTGDRVSRDPGGEIRVLGRADTLVKIAGRKVDLAEIERLVGTLPSVREVVVVHEDGCIAAWVAGPVGEQTVRSWCEAHLAPYKVPKRITVLAELPRTASRKLIRRTPEVTRCASDAPPLHPVGPDS
jgi:acyl-CoA synthetase (AMP-forming)/AMP-acid ligase II